ncbi:MAG: dicarboxylate/amino acid:cation symporter, partial [Gammaproteobacteria bacterium]
MAGKLFRNLTFWVFTAGVAGYLLAWSIGDPAWVFMDDAPAFYEFIQLLKTTFLAILKMLVAPIIFFSLIGGLLHIGDATRLRQLGSVTMLYYIGTTFIAICIGLTVVFFIHPWVGSVEQISVDRVAEGAYVQPARYIAQSSGSFVQVMQGLLSTAFTNPFTALAELNILAIATNAFLFGLAMLLVVPQTSPLVTGVHHINDMLHQVLRWVMVTMPFGIFAIIFDITLKSGGTLLSSLLGFCAVVVGGTLLHGLVVLPLIGKIFAGMDVRHFFTKASKPLMVAFATSSSSATLPISMQTAEEEL